MSDFLKTPATNVVSTIWTAGEQPTARKFNVTFNSYYQALNTVCKILGPLDNDNPSFNSRGTIVSSYTYGKMNDEEREILYEDAEKAIVNSFNLARIIGPHASLNPIYLPGSVHTKVEQATGWLLNSTKKVQQLPFPPYTAGTPYTQAGANWTCSYDVEIWSGGALSSAWKPVPTPSMAVTTKTNKVWHLSVDGTLYSNQAFTSGDYIKYTLRVPNTFGVLDSGYNCIPDLSIFSLTDYARGILYDELEYKGALIVSYISSDGSYSKWQVILPKIISAKDSLVNLDGRGFSATGSSDTFEPFGKYIPANPSVGIPTSGKRYTLPYHYISVNGTNLTENVLSLYDSARGKSYSLNLKWERTSNECVLYFYGPLSLKDQFVANDGTTLLSSGTSLTNSKDFVLFCLGTNISDTLAQTTLNYARHRHDGLDSYRISHRNLLDQENNMQGFPDDQDGSNGGLDFINYNRQLSFSMVRDNPHTQYLNRLGYRFGGSQGFYSNFSSSLAVDLNAMHGDLLFYPIYNSNPSYQYSSEINYNANFAIGDTVEEITWDLTNLSSTKTDDFVARRSHAMIFGFPAQSSNKKYLLGATKLYYEPYNFINSSSWDNTGEKWNLWRHGFIPGNTTGNGTYGRGLNIGWGNLFFGHREDILNGRFTQTETKTEASAFWRTSEFNVVTTGNNQAGNNTNSEIKNGYAYRDGFNVRAVKGSSIWLSAGDSFAAGLGPAGGKNVDSNPGTIAIEANYPAYEGSVVTGGARSLLTLNEYKEQGSSGVGIFASPGPKTTVVTGGSIENRIPWATKIPSNYTFAQLWDKNSFITLPSTAVDELWGRGPLLDIFSLALDVNKKSIDPAGDYFNTLSSATNIPVGKDSNLGSWPFGRPLVRGTYGIDFCLSGQLDNLSTDFKTGNTLYGTYEHEDTVPSEWGPYKAVLKTSSNLNEFVHREFRFWGKNSKELPSSDYGDLANTQGGNINLLYGLNQPYKRFGKSITDLTSQLSGGDATTYSPWLNARAISLGSSNAMNYGSAIRNASYVDAFQGIRHDPLQSYVAEYVYPFRAVIDTGYFVNHFVSAIDAATGNLTYVANGGPSEDAINSDITQIICQRNIVIKESTNADNPLPDNYYSNSLVFAYIEDNALPSIDALIRGSEEIFLQNSSSSYSNLFPRCLVDFKVNLDYFIGKKVANYETTWTLTESNDPQKNSPHEGLMGLAPEHENERSYGRVLVGYNVMVPASGFGVNGVTAPLESYSGQDNYTGVGLNQQGVNRLNVVMSNRQPQPFMGYLGTSTANANLRVRNNPNTIIGYQDFLGTIHATNMPALNAKYPLFSSVYDNKYHTKKKFAYEIDNTKGIIDQLFVPVVNIPDFYFARYRDGGAWKHNYNYSVPYRVYIADPSTLKPVYRTGTGAFKYADDIGTPNQSYSLMKVMVELRGKIIIKVVTAPMTNPIVD